MTKTDRVYTALMQGKSFNRFEAARLLHDTCIHSTVATLQQKHRINISRQYEIVSGYQGNPTSVCRYWIDIKERERIISRRKTAVKEAAHPTDQDKESGLQSNDLDITDDENISQITP
jgi:hypothetical protein